MAEKEIKKVPPRVENIIKGLFVVLFSIILIINVGKVGRTLAFPLVYLFGASYYFIVAFFLFLGLYRIFKQKKLKIRPVFFIVGLILLFLSINIIFGYSFAKVSNNSYSNVDLKNAINDLHGGLGKYYDSPIINLFDINPNNPNSHYLNGLVGISFGGLIKNDAIVLFIGIALFVLAVLSFVIPVIIRRKKGIKAPKEKSEYKEEKVVDNNPVIKTSRVEKEPAEIAPGFESDRSPIVNENSGFSSTAISLDEAFASNNIKNGNEYSDFLPLSFNSDPFAIQNNPQPQFTQKVEEEKVEEIVPEEINLVESRPVIEDKEEEKISEKVEEISHQIDESLVKIQPQFAPIEEIKPEPVKEEVPVETPKKKERVVWIPPSTDLLMNYETQEAQELNEKVANERVEAINKILTDYHIGAHVCGYDIGPSVTRFNIEYDSNVSSKSIEKYVQDMSRRLGGISARFAPVVLGQSYSGFEVPNATITTVGFKEIISSLPDVKKHPLAVGFGKDISGNVRYADFDEFPHILVAGTTGSGKSIFVSSIISTLIMRMSPDDLKIVLVDPKKVEMTKYRDMPHLLCPIITEADKAKVCLQKLVVEMNRRYDIFSENPEVSNIKDYNNFAKEMKTETLPYILVFIDEYADLVEQCKEISNSVVSLAQKARAAGIHMCIATQRPSTNIITGVIKGNIPTSVALLTKSYTDSIIIIGEAGAETLLGKGDMLVQTPLVEKNVTTRLQGCYIQNKEIVHIVNYLKEHYETQYHPDFVDLVDHSKEPAVNALAPGEVVKENDDEEERKYQSIKEWVMTQEFVSMSKIQRDCSVGFNRAGRFFTRLQNEGIVSLSQDGTSKGCRVLVHDSYDDGTPIVTSDELIG